MYMKTRFTYQILGILFVLCSNLYIAQVVETKLAGNHYYSGNNLYELAGQYYSYSPPNLSVPTYGNLRERAELADKLGRHNKDSYDKIKKDVLEIIPTVRDEDLKNEFQQIANELTVLPKERLYSSLTDDLKLITEKLKSLYIKKEIDDFTFYIEEQFKNKNYSLIIQKLNSLQDIEELHFWKPYMLFLAYKEVKDYSNAMLNVNKLPRGIDQMLLKSNLKSEMQDYFGAIEILDEILNANNYTDEVPRDLILNNKAYFQLKLKKFSEAIMNVNKALEVNENNWLYLDTKGEILYSLGKYSESINLMNKAINIKENENSLYYRGLAKIKIKKTDDGCRDLSKSFELGNNEAIVNIRKYCK